LETDESSFEILLSIGQAVSKKIQEKGLSVGTYSVFEVIGALEALGYLSGTSLARIYREAQEENQPL
jgi:hypothetical protein